MAQDDGILIAVSEDNSFQIISAVSSDEEARELADGYLKYGPNDDCLAPVEFQIHRRGARGHYTVITTMPV